MPVINQLAFSGENFTMEDVKKMIFKRKGHPLINIHLTVEEYIQELVTMRLLKLTDKNYQATDRLLELAKKHNEIGNIDWIKEFLTPVNMKLVLENLDDGRDSYPPCYPPPLYSI
jgi:hypothetical protein